MLKFSNYITSTRFFFIINVTTIFCGIGKINIDPNHESSKYTIIKLNELKNVIIPHFEKYPLVHLFVCLYK
jgi:hypothetical protein